MAPTVAVISAGAMGSAVAARLVAHHCTVLTNLDGRSPGSFERAEKAGMQVVTLEEVVTRSDWILSIVPPDQAEAFAQHVFEMASSLGKTTAQTRSNFTFADCNAISPATVKRISALAAHHQIPFVDACIIGGPPHEGYDPTLYASADDPSSLREFDKLGTLGLKIRLLEGEGAAIGDASALKMSYAVRRLALEMHTRN